MARGNGRRKIPMSLIVDRSTRKTTYKKRKNGLFKKAMELSILTDCKVMVFVFNENNTDISEYSTIDPREMMQMYVEQAVLPHERFTNEDYDTIGLKPAERKRLGLDAPGKRECTELPAEFQSMQRSPSSQPHQQQQQPEPKPKRRAAKRSRSKNSSSSSEPKKKTKKRKTSSSAATTDNSAPVSTAATTVATNGNDAHHHTHAASVPPMNIDPDDNQHQQDVAMAAVTAHHDAHHPADTTASGMHHQNGPSTHHDSSAHMTNIDPQGELSLDPSARSNSGGGLSGLSAPLVMPQFSLEDPNKAGPLTGVRRHGTFSSPAFRIGLTPSPGAIQTPRSGDDIQDNINAYLPGGSSIYSPNLDDLLQSGAATPKD